MTTVNPTLQATPLVDTHASLRIEPQLADRNRLTVAFRIILALPHLILVGGPIAFGLSIGWEARNGPSIDWAGGTGLLGAVAVFAAVVNGFAIVFVQRPVAGLEQLVVFYLRWRTRVLAYVTMLSDEYPPFGEGPYPVELAITPAAPPRNRVTVVFRIFLIIPHLLVLWLLSVLWLLTSIVAWFSILITGQYPEDLYEYAICVLRWSLRVESYVLLLHDDYPPFSLEA
jgi:hypothetical protein